jgi:hypothetical protein
MGYGNRYNPYGGYYNSSYTLAGYTMYVPLAKFPDRGTPRNWTRDGKSSTTNLNVTRTRSSNTSESSYNNSNSSNVSSTRSATGSTSSSNSGTRVTKRN